MDVKNQFYEWLITNKGSKESKAKEIVSVFETIDKKCVRNKGEGNFSLFNCESMKILQHIRNTFLLNKQINSALGKNAKIYNKNIDLLFEFYGEMYEEIKNTEKSKENGTQKEDSNSEEAKNDDSLNTENGEEKETEVLQDNNQAENNEADKSESKEETAKTNEILCREEILVKKVDEVFLKIGEDIKLSEQKKKDVNEEEVCVYVDLINAQMGIKSKNCISQKSLTEIYEDKNHVYDKNDGIFLENQKKLSVYNEIFISNSGKNVIEKAIYHSLKNFKLEYKGIYAMIPDVLDDFAKETRSQLIYKGERIFPIPRSVAYALGQQYDLRKKGKDYPNNSKVYFADYDGNEFTLIQLDIVKDESVKYSIFVRKGIKKVSDTHLNYNSLFDICLKEYKNNYRISFEENTIRELKDSKSFVTLFNSKKSILLKQSSGYIRLIYDKSIHEKVIEKIHNDASKLCKDLKIDEDKLIIGSSLLETKNVEFVGCSIVQERIKEQKPLWREYLPKLSLEAISGGRYREIELIKENEYRDVLKTLGEEEIIHVNGTLTFGKGKENYSLPLERNIENDINKEKESFFEHKSFPLKENVEVSLEIHYKYGDENSYKLVAKPLSKNAPFDKIENQWRDRKELPLGKVSKFVSTGGMMPNERDVARIKEAFSDCEEKINEYSCKNHRRKSLLDYAKIKNVETKKFQLLFLMYITPYPKKRTFNQQSISQVPEAYNLLDNIAKSTVFKKMFEIARKDSWWYNSFKNEVGGKKADLIVRDVREFVADMGVLYENYNCDTIVNYFINLRDVKYLAHITRCLVNDQYGAYKAISEILVDKGIDKDKIRSIASNCNFIDCWAKNLYETKNGPKALEILRDTVINLIMDHKLKKDENPRAIRDYLELLVCICAINEWDNEFINPNDATVKKLVKKIKEIDVFMDENKETLSKPFVCRLQTDNLDKQGLYKMNDLTFMLVQILTGAQDINLTGFEDKEG